MNGIRLEEYTEFRERIPGSSPALRIAQAYRNECQRRFTVKLSTLSQLAATTLLSMAVPMSVGAADTLGQKPVTLIIALAPGGSVDVETRLYAKHIGGNLLPQQFLIDYKPGASGAIAAAYIARAVPDGHTLQIISTSFTAFPALYKDLSFDTMKDFTHISQVSTKHFVLAVNPSLPYKTFPEYVAYTRANPDKVNMATTGAGGSGHLAGAWLHSMINAKATFVHYKGLSPAVIDLIAGRVQVSLVALQTTVSMFKSGKIRPIAMMGSSRTDLIPGLPTVGEFVPGYTFESYTGISGPSGISAGVVRQLNEAFAKVVKVPDVIKALDAEGSVPVGSTPGEFAKLLQIETDRWKKVAKDNNITLDE